MIVYSIFSGVFGLPYRLVSLLIIAARTDIAGSLSSAGGTDTSYSCLTGSIGTKENPNCDDVRHVRLLTLFYTVIFFLLEEGAYTFNGKRSEMDFKIHSSVQRCLR